MYFSNFPSLLLKTGTGATSGAVVAKDILRRVGINSAGGSTGSHFFLDYNINDTDTPESIAFDLYNSTTYHWVVLLFNDIFDTFFEWPLSSRKFEKFLTDKYSDTSLFFADTGLSGNFSRNDTLTKYSGTGVTGWSGIVTDYDPTLHKLTLTGVISGSEFSLDDVVRVYNSTGGVGVTQNVGEATIKKIVTDSTQALHHFETSGSTFDGYDDIGGGYETSVSWLDPLSKYNGITQVSLKDSSITFGDTLLYGYIVGGSSNYVKTNYDYELKKNEKKRTISLLKPEFLDVVVQEFKSLIGK